MYAMKNPRNTRIPIPLRLCQIEYNAYLCAASGRTLTDWMRAVLAPRCSAILRNKEEHAKQPNEAGDGNAKRFLFCPPTLEHEAIVAAARQVKARDLGAWVRAELWSAVSCGQVPEVKAPRESKERDDLLVPMGEADHDAIRKAAKLAGKSAAQWCREVLDQAARWTIDNAANKG